MPFYLCGCRWNILHIINDDTTLKNSIDSPLFYLTHRELRRKRIITLFGRKLHDKNISIHCETTGSHSASETKVQTNDRKSNVFAPATSGSRAEHRISGESARPWKAQRHHVRKRMDACVRCVQYLTVSGDEPTKKKERESPSPPAKRLREGSLRKEGTRHIIKTPTGRNDSERI